MITEKPFLFTPKEVKEISDVVSFEQAVINLIRRSLAANGRLIKPSFIDRLRGDGTTVRGEMGSYDKTHNRGITSFPVGEFEKESLPDDLAKVMEAVFGEDLHDLEIEVIYGYSSGNPYYSQISLRHSHLNDERDKSDNRPRIRFVSRTHGGREVRIDNLENDESGYGDYMVEGRVDKLCSQIIQFANERLTLQLEQPKVEQAVVS